MRTHIIKTIFRKELKEVIRDKRMLFLIILLPFFLYPILFFLIGKVGQSQQERLSQESITALVNPEAESTPLYSFLKQIPHIDFKLQSFDKATIDTMSNTIGVEIAPNFTEAIGTNGTAQVTFYSDNSKDLLKNRKNLLKSSVEQFNQNLLNQRLADAQLPEAFIQPIKILEQDLASKEQKIGKVIGSFLPMILLLFIFMGCVYIAIDITAGEKERSTLQTLFTAPVQVREIIAGKFLAVFSVGIISAFMNLSSLAIAIMIQAKMLGGNMSGFALAVSSSGWVWLILIVIFITIFLAALCLAVVLLANSYKEAQSYVSPLMMLVLIPAIMVQMPGMELNATTALIPVLNVCLAIGAILQGTFNIGLVAMVTGFVFLYAVLALFLASKTFGNENVITGEKVDVKSLLVGNRKKAVV